jgi:hypothetical protein
LCWRQIPLYLGSSLKKPRVQSMNEKWYLSIAQNAATFTIVGILNTGLQQVLSDWWIQTLWGMLCFWIWFDNFLMNNDLKMVQATHDDMVVKYTHLSELYKNERNLNLKELSDIKRALINFEYKLTPQWQTTPVFDTNTYTMEVPPLENHNTKNEKIKKSQSFDNLLEELKEQNTVMSISIKTKGRLGLAGKSCILP